MYGFLGFVLFMAVWIAGCAAQDMFFRIESDSYVMDYGAVIAGDVVAASGLQSRHTVFIEFREAARLEALRQLRHGVKWRGSQGYKLTEFPIKLLLVHDVSIR